MEKQLGQKLGNLFGLMVFGFVLFLGFYHFSQRFASQYSIHNQPGRTDRSNALPQESRSTQAPTGEYYLLLNQKQSIGQVDLIYRGIEGGRVCLIDVIIPALDPQSPYKYRLDIDTAEKGFRMAGHTFKLVAAGKNYVRLESATP